MASSSGTFGTPTDFSIQEMLSDGSASLPSSSGGVTIILGGRALPYRPMAWPGEMRAEVTSYPGNPIKTLQMLGSLEGELTITGFWKDRFISPIGLNGQRVSGSPPGRALVNGDQVQDVMALHLAMDNVRRRGQLLEVRWDVLIRQGYMKKYTPTFHRHQDIEFEIQFEWISQGEKQVAPTFATQYSFQDLNSQLQLQMSNILAALQGPFLVAEDIQTKFDTATGLLQEAVNDIGNVTLNLSGLASTPYNAAQRTQAALHSVQTNAQALISVIESVPPYGLISGAGPQQATVGTSAEAAEYGRNVKSAARAMASTAADQSDQLANRTSTQTLLAVFQARQHQDLRDVSTQYYGTQEQWKAIAQFNGITGSKLQAGQTIYIPKLATSLSTTLPNSGAAGVV